MPHSKYVNFLYSSKAMFLSECCKTACSHNSLLGCLDPIARYLGAFKNQITHKALFSSLSGVVASRTRFV